MIKQSIFLFVFTLLFTACGERAQTLNPTINPSMAKPIVKHSAPAVKSKPTAEKNTGKKIITPVASISPKVSQECNVIATSPMKVNDTVDENDSFFALSEETKIKISGFFVIIIGIIILI